MGAQSNLVAKLLRFATGSRSLEEDPITEVLAWLLRQDNALLDAFVATLERTAGSRAHARLTGRHFDVSTQVVVRRAHGQKGVCRYDLVLDHAVTGLRVVVEIKVAAALTASSASEPLPASAAARTQVDDYLDIAEESQRPHLVFLLAPRWLDVGKRARACGSFGGHVSWQAIHDAFGSVNTRGETAIDPAARIISQQLIAIMEARNMATPRLSFDGALSVRRYDRFEKSIKSMLTDSWNKLHLGDALMDFHKIDTRAWQREFDRLGYRLWASRSTTSHFGFMGLWYGDDTLVPEVPDLYFFLEVPRSSTAAAAIDEKADEIRTAVAELNGPGRIAQWGFDPGGYQTIWAVKTIADVIPVEDCSEAVHGYFHGVLKAARDSGLLAIYLAAVRRDSPESPAQSI